MEQAGNSTQLNNGLEEVLKEVGRQVERLGILLKEKEQKIQELVTAVNNNWTAAVSAQRQAGKAEQKLERLRQLVLDRRNAGAEILEILGVE